MRLTYHPILNPLILLIRRVLFGKATNKRKL